MEAVTTKPSPSKDPKFKRVTMPEQGPRLPIGTDPEGKHRDIVVKGWNLGKEKELGELRKKQAESNLGVWASVLLSEMCTRIGQHDFTKMNESERRLAISMMSMPDVLYAYTWLRFQSMGPTLRIEMECPYHEFEFVWPGDLRTLEIRVVENIEEARWSFDLHAPFEVRGKESKQWELGPVPWSAIEEAKLGRRINQGQLKATMIHSSIHQIDGESVALGENELDEMGKWDLERHIAEIDRHTVGPDFSIRPRCPHESCERLFASSIDWSYDTFFGISSR